MILGDLIRQYRQEHSCSMEQFAKLSGLSKAYVSILERNVNPANGKPVIPSLETIKAVSQTINMDFNDVLALLDDMKPAQPIRPAIKTSLLSIFDELNETGQSKVLAYAEDLYRTDYCKKTHPPRG